MDSRSIESSPIVKRPYEDETETTSSFNGDSVASAAHGYVTNSVVGAESSRRSGISKPSGPSSSTGCRQRVTVVCGECKRLKLKCDRRVPCGSCQKRDTVQRCIYSQAASEKVDVQSLNNRLLEVEAKLRVQEDGSSKPKGFEGTGLLNGKPRAYLAVGTHSSSVAVNLEGTTGIWVDQLGLSNNFSKSSSSPAEGIELQPYPSIPDEGVVDFYTEFAPLFRLPASLVSMTSNIHGHAMDGEVEPDSEEGEEEDSCGSLGISPKLVLKAFPPRHIRNEIYERLDKVHLMSPMTNIFVLRSRIEDMYRWAELRSEGKRPTDQDGDQLLAPPSVNSFAAAAMGMALGAECWAAEFTASSSSNSSPSPGGACVSSSKSMPPPPVPGSVSTTSDGPTAPVNSSPSTSQNIPRMPYQPGTNIAARHASSLYRVAKFAISLSVEGAGYGAFDIDYMIARCMQARYLLHSHRGLGAPTGGASQLLNSLSVGDRRRKALRKRKPPTDGDSLDNDPSMINGESSNGRSETDVGFALALAPEMVSCVSDMVGTARLMGLNHDPDGPGGGRLSLYEKEIRRRVWWEISSWDVFVSECIGEPPLITDNFSTTKMPADVDEESFGPDSANLPAPNIESDSGNIEYFIQRSKLVNVVKRLRAKLIAFRMAHDNPDAAQRHEMIEMASDVIRQHVEEMSDHLRLKDPLEVMESKAKARLSGESTSPEAAESPHLLALRCETAISTRYMLIMSILPFARADLRKSLSPFDSDIALPGRIDFLTLLEPAITIVKLWKHVHSTFRHIRPSMFFSYSFSRQLFDSAVVLAHLATEQPTYAGHALTSVRSAYELLRDPSVLTGRSGPSEASRIVEELILKAENMFIGSPTIIKRKFDEVERPDFSRFLHNFRIPFAGTGASISSSGSPRLLAAGESATVKVNSQSTTVFRANGSAKAANDSETKSTRATQKQTSGDSETRPPSNKHKSSHPGVSIRARTHGKAREAHASTGRTRTNSSSRSGPPVSRNEAPQSSVVGAGQLQPTGNAATPPSQPSTAQGTLAGSSGASPADLQPLNPIFPPMSLPPFTSPPEVSSTPGGFQPSHFAAPSPSPGFPSSLGGPYNETFPDFSINSSDRSGLHPPQFGFGTPERNVMAGPSYDPTMSNGVHRHSPDGHENHYVETNLNGNGPPHPHMSSLAPHSAGNQYRQPPVDQPWLHQTQAYQPWGDGNYY